MKRFCKSEHCDVKCAHVKTFNDDGAPIWMCGNCGKETPRLTKPQQDMLLLLLSAFPGPIRFNGRKGQTCDYLKGLGLIYSDFDLHIHVGPSTVSYTCLLTETGLRMARLCEAISG